MTMQGNRQVLPDKLKEQAAELRRQYQRQYRAANRDKVRRWNERYWTKKALQIVAASAEPEVTED